MEDLLTIREAVAVGVGHVGAGLVARFVGITEAVVIQVFGADRRLGHATRLWILRFPAQFGLVGHAIAIAVPGGVIGVGA